jgi:Family of unknown function (DUF5766)
LPTIYILYKMDGLNVIANINCDDYDDYDDCELDATTITFKFYVNDVHFADMLLSEPHMFTSYDYCEIIGAENSNKCLDFCTSNGNVSIIRTHTDIIFDIGKFGAGGDGSISIIVPIESCRQAFLNVVKWREMFE